MKKYIVNENGKRLDADVAGQDEEITRTSAQRLFHPRSATSALSSRTRSAQTSYATLLVLLVISAMAELSQRKSVLLLLITSRRLTRKPLRVPLLST